MWGEWENTNPFIYTLFLSIFILCLHFYYRDRTSASSLRPICLQLQSQYLPLLYLLYLIAAISLLFFLIFEHYYYSYNCTVSNRYYEQNLVLTKDLISLLESIGIPYYPDFASLMNVLRSEEINAWDHDTDVSIEWPPPYSTVPSHYGENQNYPVHITAGSSSPLQEGLSSLYTSSLTPRPLYEPNPDFSFDNFLASFTQFGFFYDFDADRDLLQIRRSFDSRASWDPHFDIWLWRRNSADPTTKLQHGMTNIHQVETQEGEEVGPYALTTPEPSIRTFSRSFGLIYPLETATWLGRNVTIPHLAHPVSRLEYGASYMTPMVLRRDCMHNLFHGRFKY